MGESSGYVVNFDPYQGAKNGKSVKASDNAWGLGEVVVLSLLDILPENISYRVFTDNFYICKAFTIFGNKKDSGLPDIEGK